MVIWITGISGAGKTTLATALAQMLKARLPNLVVLDGDAIRAVFGSTLGYSIRDRLVQIQRLQSLAAVLDGQNIVTVVAAVYSSPEVLLWNRKNFSPYYEIYLKASLQLVQQRDSKRIYSEALAGRLANVVGLDIPWLEPEFPDLVIDADEKQYPEQLAFLVAQLDPLLKNALLEN